MCHFINIIMIERFNSVSIGVNSKVKVRFDILVYCLEHNVHVKKWIMFKLL